MKYVRRLVSGVTRLPSLPGQSLYKVSRPRNVHVKCNVGSDKMIDHLKNINQLEQTQMFATKLTEVRAVFGEEISKEIEGLKSFNLACDLLFIHNHYGSKVILNDADKKQMRDYVIATYHLFGSSKIPPKVHEAIVGMLKKCDAM